MQKIQNPKLSKESRGKSKHICSSYFPTLQLYKPSVKMVSWKYFQIYFMHMSAFLHLPSFMFVDVINVGGFACHWWYTMFANSLINAIELPCSIVPKYHNDLIIPNSWPYHCSVFSQCFSEHPYSYITVHKCKFICRIDSQETELLGQRLVCGFCGRYYQTAFIEIVSILLSLTVIKWHFKFAQKRRNVHCQ